MFILFHKDAKEYITKIENTNRFLLGTQKYAQQFKTRELAQEMLAQLTAEFKHNIEIQQLIVG